MIDVESYGLCLLPGVVPGRCGLLFFVPAVPGFPGDFIVDFIGEVIEVPGRLEFEVFMLL
jgi:hypothetical protein